MIVGRCETCNKPTESSRTHRAIFGCNGGYEKVGLNADGTMEEPK